MALKVVVADDHALIRTAVRTELERDGDFEVVGEADNGARVLPLVHRHHPDLVLLDMRMPGADGLSCLDRMRAEHPDVKVVVLSASTDRELVADALRRGAAGYISKSIDPVDLPGALRQALAGTTWFRVGDEQSPTEHVQDSAGLTDRELDMLRAVARGLSNKQISAELFVTEQTVKFHLSNVYRKIGVANRAGAVRYAADHGLAGQDVSEP